jgi:hypothetical protein
LAVIAFNPWTKSALPVSNAIMAVDVLLGVYFAERSKQQSTTFKGLCWDLRCSEQAIRSIVERLNESRWIVFEQDDRFRRTISRLRIPADKVTILDTTSGSSKAKSQQCCWFRAQVMSLAMCVIFFGVCAGKLTCVMPR